MPEACSNGVRISYDDRGRGGPALLFLPGWCSSREVFADLLPRLSATRRRVLALDWRGHGGSEAATAPFGADELVEDVMVVIEVSGVCSVVSAALFHTEPDGSVIAEGTCSLRVLNRKAGFEFPLEGPKTINGLLLEELEDIPEGGTTLNVAGHPIEIMQVQNRMVKVVRIQPQLLPQKAAQAA